jgi:hypothetical protein
MAHLPTFLMAGKTLEAEWNPLNVNDWSICDLREREENSENRGKNSQVPTGHGWPVCWPSKTYNTQYLFTEILFS